MHFFQEISKLLIKLSDNMASVVTYVISLNAVVSWNACNSLKHLAHLINIKNVFYIMDSIECLL
jgi:hypothetical protein